MSQYTGRNGSPPISVSQNYLTSAKTIRRLLGLTSLTKSDRAIEIGAGKGHITRELAGKCHSVYAFEIDAKICAYLQSKLGGIGNLHIRHQDFLTVALPSSEPYKVFSNIPFSITSKIIRKLTGGGNPPQEAWLVMEKGTAKRFAGKSRDTTASLSLKPYFDCDIVHAFSRQDFHPMPSVDVVLLHLLRKEKPDIPLAQKREFLRFVERGQRYGLTALLTKRQVAAALKQAGLPRIEQSGLMLYVQWLCLFRCFRRFHGGQNGPARCGTARGLQRWTRAAAPFIRASTSLREAMEVSPGVVIASAPWATP